MNMSQISGGAARLARRVKHAFTARLSGGTAGKAGRESDPLLHTAPRTPPEEPRHRRGGS